MKNLPNPTGYAAEIKTLIAPRNLDVDRHQHRAVPDIIAAGEGQYLEFKSSLSWDYRRQRINKDLNEINSKTVCRVMVSAAPRPVFLSHNSREEFYIRTGNSSQPLAISQAV